MSEELINFAKSPYNKYPANRQAMPIIIRVIDRIDERLKVLEGKYDVVDEPLPEESMDNSQTVEKLDESAIDKLMKQLDELSNESRKIDEEEAEIDRELEDDACSVCTEQIEEEKKRVIADPNLEIVGKWRVEDHKCNDCVKKTLKTYKKAQKEKEKAEKQKLKELKRVQKKLLEAEERLLKQRLKDLKKNRKNTNYGKEETEINNLKKMIKDMAKNQDLQNHLHVNLYV